MLFQKPQIFFNKPDYVTVHSVLENTTIMFLSYCYLALVGKGLLQHTMGNFAVWLGCYICVVSVLSYLTTVNQCLTMFLSRNYVPLERSLLKEVKKKYQTTEKVGMLKMPLVNLLF